ncbi:Holliday junction branch migration protein RuvA [Candidatus Phytoplasma sp. AldY-WA1]|jgi:Holliday junction DNA helicase RuvA|uniref:Holliday junction branch migration protein RuvA n=1 Tax=Candidatus Phytoplasma sp. AldY-WA1 TaxID=2852100 RepID=UPI001CE23A98|nr:Holliday junction branch migration protein RuvA [Candidatus Phytoplasma sp. AldY-WA1]
MYFYIKGKVTSIQNDSVVLDNNGIGYHIGFANPYVFYINQEVKLFTYFYIKENIHFLYGFLDTKILFFFKKLIAIPGIGPKSAILLTNQDFFQEIQKAISENNVSYLLKLPGIGQKTAQQIIFHLKNNDLFQTNKILLNPKQKDVKEVLINLGFKNKEVDKVINKLDFDKKIEIIVKEALSLIMK